MEQVGIASKVNLAELGDALLIEADSLIDKLLTIKPEPTVEELLQLLNFETTPTTKIAKALLNRRLSESQRSKVIQCAAQNGYLDEIWVDIPEQWWNKKTVRLAIAAIHAKPVHIKSVGYIDRLGSMLMEQEDVEDEDFVFVISHIPALRDAAWDRMIFKQDDRMMRVLYVVRALAYFTGENAERKTVWFLEMWPDEASRLLGSADLGVSKLAAQRILIEPDFNDGEIGRLTCWDKFRDTDIPERAIKRALSEPSEKTRSSLASILLSTFATETQKEQAAALLLKQGVWLSADCLESIIRSIPLYASEAKARLEKMIAAEEAKKTAKQRVMDRLFDLESEYNLRVR